MDVCLMKPFMLLRLCVILREIKGRGEGLRRKFNYHIQQVPYDGGIRCTHEIDNHRC